MDEVKSSSVLRAWCVCLSASLFFFYELMQVNMFNSLNPSLMREFHLTAEAVSTISVQYFNANLLFLFLAGAILDRLSVRWVILMAMLICVGGTFGLAHSDTLNMARISRFATGIGGAFCLLSCIRLASRWFEPKKMAFVIGVVVTIGMLGGFVAQQPMVWLIQHLDWRRALQVDAYVGLLFWLLILWVIKDYPEGYDQSKEHGLSTTHMPLTQALRQTLSNLQNWFAGMYTSLMNLPIFILGAIWGNLYLVQIKGLAMNQASMVTSMLFMGSIVGCSVIGWWSDRLGRRCLPMTICNVLSLIVVLLMMFTGKGQMVYLASLFFFLGFFTSAQIISYPLIAEHNSKSLTGMAEGLGATLIMAGGLLQPVSAWLLELHWDHKLQAGLPVYSTHDYLLALSMLPIAFVLSLLLMLFIKETHCRAFEGK